MFGKFYWWIDKLVYVHSGKNHSSIYIYSLDASTLTIPCSAVQVRYIGELWYTGDLQQVSAPMCRA